MVRPPSASDKMLQQRHTITYLVASVVQLIS